MAYVDARATSVARKGKHTTAGRINVHFRKPNGTRVDATIIGPGTTSGVKLRLGSFLATGKILDNVPLSVSRSSVNSYIYRGF